jgi:hypothetical protein
LKGHSAKLSKLQTTEESMIIYWAYIAATYLMIGYLSDVPKRAAATIRKQPRRYAVWVEFPIRVAVVAVIWLFWPFTAVWQAVMPKGPID